MGSKFGSDICGPSDRHGDFNAGFLGVNEKLAWLCSADLSHSRYGIVEGHRCFDPEWFLIIQDSKNVERRNHDLSHSKLL